MLKFENTKFTRIQGKFSTGPSYRSTGWARVDYLDALCEVKPRGLLLVTNFVFGVPVGYHWYGNMSYSHFMDIAPNISEYDYLLYSNDGTSVKSLKKDLQEGLDYNEYSDGVEVELIKFLMPIEENLPNYAILKMECYIKLCDNPTCPQEVVLQCTVQDHPLFGSKYAKANIARRFLGG